MTADDVAGTAGVLAETPDLFQARLLARARAEVDEVGSAAVHVAAADEPSVVRATGPIHVLLDGLIDLPDVTISETRSRYLLRHRMRWRPGDPTPGVSVLFRVRRNPDLGVAEFHDYWEHGHGPKALTHHLGMWDYEQLSIVDAPASDLDGVAVVQFPCLDDYKRRFFDGPEGERVIRADAAHFTARGSTLRQLTTEQVMKAPPLPEGSPVMVSDHRQLELTADPDDVWRVLGDFGGILEWWPEGLAGCEIVGDDPATRVLTRSDGSTVTEALLRRDDAERMLQLGVQHGFPGGITDYTCRYEVRAVPNGCRVDWDPRATVQRDSSVLLAGIVDEGWRRVAAGLGAIFELTPPSIGSGPPPTEPDD